MTKCSQCDKPAVFNYDGIPLCVDHNLKVQQTVYLQASLVASQFNMLSQQLYASTGGIVGHSRINLSTPPSFIGDNSTLKNINVSGSTIGTINTGTIRNLDVNISLIKAEGQDKLASAVKDFTQAIIDSKDLKDVAKTEATEQLEVLTSQLISKKQNRSIGLVKAILAGIRDTISVSAGLITLWDKIAPLFRSAFGI